jgi:hypothetical protein
VGGRMKKVKKRKSRKLRVILFILSIEALLIIGGLAYVQLRPMVVETVTMQAGDVIPDIKEFLIYDNNEGIILTNLHELDTKQPGVYALDIQIGKRVHTSSLTIVDTIPPNGVTEDQITVKGEMIEADSFLTEVKDETEVTVTYQKAPDTSKPGVQDVTLILEDTSRNHTELKAKLTVLDMNNAITVEAGSMTKITIADFIPNNQYKATFVTNPDMLDLSKTNIHNILINVDGKEIPCSIIVEDTIAPTALAQEQELWIGETSEALSFVKEIQDFSDVTASFKNSPDFTKLGEQDITILLQDASGNLTEITSKLSMKEDKEPPQILGIEDKTVYMGETISYRKGVYAKDNKDEDLKVDIDSSKVNLKKEGKYTVTYTAQDTSGNKTSVNKTITVIKFAITEEEVNQLADNILGKITKADMTKIKKAEAIYKWVKAHVNYTGSSDKSDWLAEAYRGIKNGVGDCFTYYAVSQELLTRAGIDNMRVTRVGGKTQHFWNLVNCGEGWYHFDSCPNRDHKESFMLTDKEVEKLTEIRGKNYYVFDKSLYPATPEE